MIPDVGVAGPRSKKDWRVAITPYGQELLEKYLTHQNVISYE